MDNYINSVCFLRLGNDSKDVLQGFYSFIKQIETNNEYGINATYLLEPDALEEPTYIDVIRNNTKNGDEIGLWFEVVKPLVETAGLIWRGRDNRIWDHFVDPGFLMAYTEEEKVLLIDTAMKMFYEKFVYYPKTVGSWLIDSFSMEYMTEKYEIDAYIICREQWGMDGYTLWGAPYYGGYYPCKNNMMSPAQTKEHQINTPVFKMFVNDPIYCYYEYAEEKYNKVKYHLFTQEPVWMCGQNPDWVKWQFDNVYNTKNVGFNYLQLGQENGFGWLNAIDKAYVMQHEFVKENKEKYGLKNVTVGEMGRLFKQKYETTPNKAMGTLTDWAENGNKSVWFNNSSYRINAFSDNEQVWIRDLRLFDENYRDNYLDEPCTTFNATYDTLSLMDGIRFSDEKTRAGMYFGNGSIKDYGPKDGYYAVNIIADGKEKVIKLYENEICIKGDNDFGVDFIVGDNIDTKIKMNEKSIDYICGKYKYKLNVEKGSINDSRLCSDDGILTLSFKRVD